MVILNLFIVCVCVCVFYVQIQKMSAQTTGTVTNTPSVWRARRGTGVCAGMVSLETANGVQVSATLPCVE